MFCICRCIKGVSKKNMASQEDVNSDSGFDTSDFSGSSSFSSWKHLMDTAPKKRSLGRVKTTAVKIFILQRFRYYR